MIPRDSKKSATKVSKKSKKSEAIVGQAGRAVASRVLRRPHVTEKTHMLSENGVYVFEVHVDADKTLVKRSVEELYNVTVESVNMIKCKGVKRNFGRFSGNTKAYKKAMVRLRKGQSIEIFKGA